MGPRFRPESMGEERPWAAKRPQSPAALWSITRCSGHAVRLWTSLDRFCREEDATTSVEYAVVLAMILMACFGAIQMVGGQAGGLWGGIIDDLRTVGFIK